MILQELYRYYERKKNEGDTPPLGYENKEIHYLIIVEKDGTFVRFESMIEKENNKERGRIFAVPQAVKRTSGIEANLLWDNLEYVLGIQEQSKQKESEQKKTNRIQEQKKSFYTKIQECYNETLEQDLKAVLAFEKVSLNTLKKDPLWKEIISRETGANLTFQIRGKKDLICESLKIQDYLKNNLIRTSNQENLQTCLVTGEQTEIAVTHPSIKGVYDTQSSGANIVSFNLSAFESYSKKQSLNAPIGKYAAFAYTSALNSLLSKESTQKLRFSNTTVVFWSEKKSTLENEFCSFFEFENDSLTSNGEAKENAVIRRLLEAPKTGKMGELETNTNFYVLGLAPNASRISIRFWHQATVSEIENNLRQYFQDIKIVHPQFESEILSLNSLLRSTAVLGKEENIHPLMASGFFEAILKNKPFPRIVLLAVITRTHANPSTKEEKKKIEMRNEYCRAALLKAYLNRLIRAGYYHTKQLEEKMDEKNTNIAYRLGRLFAVLDRLQATAIGNLNASIRDRYYAAAASKPATVFPILLNLANHHISKIESSGIWFDKLIQEILSVFPAENPFPRVMTIEEQGIFSVGYYQQKQWLFTKKEDRKQE